MPPHTESGALATRSAVSAAAVLAVVGVALMLLNAAEGGRTILDTMSTGNLSAERAAGALSSSIGAIGSLFIVLIVGIYVAANPGPWSPRTRGRNSLALTCALLAQRRAIAMPPAITIAAQVVLGVLVGGIGVIVVTPLTAAVVTAP